jgi:aminopeptidase N
MVGNATQSQPWLDESMAEFLTWQFFLDHYGVQEAQSYRAEMQSSWDLLNEELIPVGLPVSGYTSEGYSAIVYGRGPLFILALRDTMGTISFDRFLRDYSLHFQWAIATTSDFKNMAEQDCGCDLSSLFNAWIYP